MNESNAHTSLHQNRMIAQQCCNAINTLDKTSFLGQDIPSWRASRNSLIATIVSCGYELQTAEGSSPQGWVIKPLPSAAPALRHFAVSGRIPGSDEDTLLTLQAADREDAMERFTSSLYDLEADPAASRRNVMDAFGDLIYITSVAASDSPIELVD